MFCAYKRNINYVHGAAATLLAVVCGSVSAQSVVCPSPDYYIDSDADLANFYVEAKTCSIVTGDVTITGQLSANTPGGVQVTLPLQEIRGKLSILDSNVRAVKSVGARTLADGAVLEEDDLLKVVNNLAIRDNADLNNIELIDLQMPPHDIEVRNNPLMARVALTPASPPPLNNSHITLEGNWVFADSLLTSIEIGFPTLQLHLEGDLIIDNTRSYIYNLGDFSGLRSVNDLVIKLRFGGVGFEPASLGEVLYGTNQFGDLEVFVTGGFQDLHTAHQIDINQAGYTDVSFPELVTVDSFSAFGQQLVDVNAPKLQQVRVLKLQGLSEVQGAKFGDRTGSRGRGWGLGRLQKVDELLEVWVEKPASATDLRALNIGFNNNLTLGEGGSIVIYSGVEDFSLANLRGIPGEIGTLIFYGLRREDFDGPARAQLSGLDAFAAITTINSRVWLQGLQFDDLSFLRNVRTIGQELLIYNDSSRSLVNASGSLNGLEGIESVGGDLLLESMNLEDCYALLPLVGWGDSPVRVSGDILMRDNEPASCNQENLDSLRAEASPGPFDVARTGLVEGGVSLYAFSPSQIDLFPVVNYEAACRATNSKSTVSLPGQTFTLPAGSTTPISLTFDQAGLVDYVSITTDFKTVDRSQITIRATAPDSKFSPTLWDGDGLGTKGWVRTFSPQNAAGLSSFLGTEADGEWTLNFTPGASSAALNSVEITIDSLYRSIIPATDLPEDYFLVPISGMPPGDTFQCQFVASNAYGVTSTTDSLQVVTPPPITTGPSVLNVEETTEGLLVYFDPTAYFGSQWFGDVSYVATCGPSGSDNGPTISSAPVSSSPALIEGLTTDSNLDCSVTIDNVYQTFGGPVATVETEAPQSLPIWLLYEASRR